MSQTPITSTHYLPVGHDGPIRLEFNAFLENTVAPLERALNECEVALKTDYYDTLSAKRRSDALATVAKLREKYK